MTPLLAATGRDGDGPWLLLAGVILLTVIAYSASCLWWPYAHCRRCDGRGKHSRKDGKVWRTCRRCKGSGRRLRVGRRLWNHWAKLREDAK